jgi:glycine/D-amino acid oxidase-like deaminating enzyme
VRLKSGNLFWPRTARAVPGEAPPRGHLRCDVLVIGAGISGAMAAYHLARAGARVIVVDRRPQTSGSTPASTALVLYELDTPLVRLAERFGLERAQRAYAECHGAVARMTTLVRTLRRECELYARPSLYLARRERDESWLRDEAAARRAVGIAASFLTGSALRRRFGLERPCAILSRRALEVNPMKLTRALLERALDLGARLFRGTEIGMDGVARRRGPLTVRNRRATITADWAVIATGYEAPEQFADIARLCELRSTYVIATNRLKRAPWPRRALLWEATERYAYARTTRDGRVLFGGGDIAGATAARRDRLLAAKSRALMKSLRTLAPHLRARVEHRWAGTFAQTPSGLPFIGRHPRWRRAIFSLGYAGNGFTFALIAGELIRDIVGGARPELERLFGFTRLAG